MDHLCLTAHDHVRAFDKLHKTKQWAGYSALHFSFCSLLFHTSSLRYIFAGNHAIETVLKSLWKHNKCFCTGSFGWKWVVTKDLNS